MRLWPGVLRQGRIRHRPRKPCRKMALIVEKVNARLAFTPERLMTTLEIRRKPSP